MKNIFKILILAVTASCVVSCSSSKNEKEEGLSDPALLYEEASSLLEQSKYDDSAKKFERLEREHPASELASKAQVKRAYAHYSDGKFDDAISVVDDFVKKHPANPNSPYMYYLKGLCYYQQIVDIGRDQVLSDKAIEAFEELINRFPESTYSKDAKLKIEYALNLLAGKEMEIGRFYLNQVEYVAALNRFKTVVTKYQTSIFISEALYRMSEIYYALGDIREAQVYASILGHNYPDSDWYKKAYELVIKGKSEIKLPWYRRITRI